MNYDEARAFMEGRQSGIHLGLDRIQALLKELNHPEEKLRVIHIAGTNGKGSILSYISTTLSEAGYKVGRYISPTLYSYEERFQIDGQAISKERYCQLAERIKKQVEVLEDREGNSGLSAFELETVLCFLYFQEEGCDYVVLECGMGGRDDATNVIPHPELCVFASISLDHMGFLGNTVEEIADVKSGIIKAGCKVVSGPQSPSVLRVLEEASRKAGCYFVSPDLSDAFVEENSLDGQIIRYQGARISIQLPGACQVENVITAYTALKVLEASGEKLTQEKILHGLSKTLWTGRFTPIHRDPLFIVDGAHNPDAAFKLHKSIETYFDGRPIIYLMGVLKDKDYTEVIRLTAPLANQIFTIETPNNPRALPSDLLAEAIAPVNSNVTACHSLKEGVEMALQAANSVDKEMGKPVIIAFGSLSFIGEMTEILSTY